jgi:DNA polymerase/3'-5' exonuclease PolX
MDELEMILASHARQHDFEILKNGPRMKQLALPEGIHIDLFIVRPPAQWGVIYLIRTGPADFSKWMVTQKSKGGGLPDGCFLRDGCVWQHGDGKTWPPSTIVETPEESDYFTLCGMEWIEPSKRQPMWRKQPA